jgi:hypothetical protein
LLAYVFWHVPRPGVAVRDYESAHREFHTVLWKSKVDGLIGLRVFRLAAIPWLGGNPGYEDWHLLENSAGLDVLNGAAVSQARQLPHDRIAAMAADGTAGLYGLRMGSMNEVSHAFWLSKPAGMSYSDFDTSLKPDVEAGACLWGRRMTLGPTPEFCLHASTVRRPVHDAHPMVMSPVFQFHRDQVNL